MLSFYCCSQVGLVPKRSRYVDPSLGRRKDQQDARVSAVVKKKRLEERKKRFLFASIDDVKRFTKQEYRKFHN
jgi:hypothetical protein